MTGKAKKSRQETALETTRGGRARTDLVNLHAELSFFDIKRDLDHPDVVHLSGVVVHRVRGRGDEDLVLAGRADDAHDEVDDLVRPDTEEHVLGPGQATEGGDTRLDVDVGWGGVSVEVLGEEGDERVVLLCGQGG